MFGMDMTTIAFVGLATLAVAGLIFAAMYERIASEVRTEQRVKSINTGDKQNNRIKAAQRVADAAKRKKTVQDSLKELEAKQVSQNKNKSVGIKKQIQQAGLKITMQQFVMMSVVCGLVCGALAFIAGAPPLGALAGVVIGGLGLPRWLVGFIRGRRMKQFVEEFPNAVDVIVRGVRAGLPLGDCMGIIAREAKEPVASEFRRVIEAQQMGLTLPDSVQRLYENIPLPESNFFGIVITIQAQAGGNLSEALSNLSVVLRDRKKMKAKIQAMSAEAKASGMIIGALPFIVALLVYLTTPDYIKILFTDPTGNIVLVCSGIWMSIGIMVMKKMISFDF